MFDGQYEANLTGDAAKCL